MNKVMFYEVFREEEEALKRYLTKHLRASFTWKTIAESKHKRPPARLICVRTQSRIPASWLDEIDGVLTRSQGFDHLQPIYKQNPKAALGYLKPYSSTAVAEHAVLLAMALCRRLPQQLIQMDSFCRDGLTGESFIGKRVLVVGVGSIGKEIVKICRALKCDVRGVDPVQSSTSLSYVSLSKGIAWADVIIAALPFTAETKGILGYSRVKQSLRIPVIVNVGRGETSPTKDLLRLLNEGRIRGVGLDVYEDEDRLAEALRQGTRGASDARIIRQLQKTGKALLTPHNAFNTEESLQKKAALTVQSIEYFLQARRFPAGVPKL